MKKQKIKNAIVIKFNEIASVETYLSKIKEDSQLQEHNLIIDLSKDDKITIEDLSEFSVLSELYRNTLKHSLIIVTSKFSYDDLPEHISVSPTLEEAFDIIELEEIERDLGF